MANNPHRRVVGHALRVNEQIGRLFDRLGNAGAPRGAVLSAYRSAIRALRGMLDNNAAVEDALTALRFGVSRAIGDVLDEASELGLTFAERSLSAWNQRKVMALRYDTAPAHDAVISKLDAQIASVRAQMRVGQLDEDEVLGDASHVGILRPSDVILAGSIWVTTTVMAAYEQVINQSVREQRDEWGRQAVAAIDERTTDCCLQVHGQIVGLNDDFELTGEPRFADHMHAPPFHWYCRTATALVLLDKADDKLTQAMRSAAKAEIEARKERGFEEIHPASALSRRR